MDRFTTRRNDKVYTIRQYLNGEYFQLLLEKLAEYEDLDEKGLIGKSVETMSNTESEINEKEILSILLDQIILLTQKDTDFDLKTVLPAYCKKEHFEEEYDGLFWSNEGATWKYKNNLSIVKLVDEYYVTYRKLYFPWLSHKNVVLFSENDEWVNSKFPCRYDYLKNKNKL